MPIDEGTQSVFSLQWLGRRGLARASLAFFLNLTFLPLTPAALAKPKAAEAKGDEALGSRGAAWHLNLDFRQSKSDAAKASKAGVHTTDLKAAWVEGCPALAMALAPQQGLLGSGLFSSASCFFNGKKISGPKRKSVWLLRIEAEGQQVKVSLVFSAEQVVPSSKKNKDDREQLVAAIIFPGAIARVQQLSNQRWHLLLAFYLLDHLPVSYTLTPQRKDHLALEEGRNEAFKELAGAAVRAKLAPPKQMHIKVLQDDKNTKNTAPADAFTTRGEAKLVYEYASYPKGSKELPKKLKTRAREGAPLLVWQCEKSCGDEDKKAVLARTTDKPGEQAALIQGDLIASFTDEASYMTSLTNSLVSAGYVGVRFGFPVLRGTLFSGETRMFGLVAERRGGWLAGLKYHLDVWPAASDDFRDQTITFAGQRNSLSFKVSLNLENDFISALDISPKIGLWSFKIDVPIMIDDEDFEIVKFAMANKLNMGVEVGAEHALSSYIMRVWYGFDAAALTAKASGNSVNSNAAGADLLFGLPSLKFLGLEFVVSGMIFVVYERFGLSSFDSSGAKLDIAYSQVFYGNGMTLSW